MKKDVKKHVDVKSAVMNTKKKRKKIKQLAIKNLSKRYNRKNEYMNKKSSSSEMVVHIHPKAKNSYFF